ncbi:unnamed protein product [Sphagnum tenellum]
MRGGGRETDQALSPFSTAYEDDDGQFSQTRTLDELFPRLSSSTADCARASLAGISPWGTSPEAPSELLGTEAAVRPSGQAGRQAADTLPGSYKSGWERELLL